MPYQWSGQEHVKVMGDKRGALMLFCEKEDVRLRRSLRLSKFFNMETSISSYFVDGNDLGTREK